MKLGTHIKLPDGRTGTVVYNSLIGVGIKWGKHDPSEEDFINTDGNTISDGAPDGWPWEPDALLREPLEVFLKAGWECVGEKYEII